MQSSERALNKEIKRELEEYKRKYNDAQIQINDLKHEIDQLKSQKSDDNFKTNYEVL